MDVCVRLCIQTQKTLIFGRFFSIFKNLITQAYTNVKFFVFSDQLNRDSSGLRPG